MGGVGGELEERAEGAGGAPRHLDVGLGPVNLTGSEGLEAIAPLFGGHHRVTADGEVAPVDAVVSEGREAITLELQGVAQIDDGADAEVIPQEGQPGGADVVHHPAAVDPSGAHDPSVLRAVAAEVAEVDGALDVGIEAASVGGLGVGHGWLLGVSLEA